MEVMQNTIFVTLDLHNFKASVEFLEQTLKGVSKKLFDCFSN